MTEKLIEIGGSARSFCASYGKDLTIGYIEAFKNDLPKNIRIKEVHGVTDLFDYFADHIYEWCTQDSKKPMTDAQMIKIEQLIEQVKPDDEVIKRIKLNINTYTMEQASQVIEKLLEMGLPEGYTDGVTFAQRDIMKATKDRVNREP